MAVEDKYVNADIVAGTKGKAVEVHGAKTVVAIVAFEIAAADDNLSIYRILKNIPASAVIQDIEILNDVITLGSDYNLGLYKTLERGGAVIDDNVFADAIDFTSARIHGAGLSGLTAVDVANAANTVFEHAGDTLDTREVGYDLAFTAIVVGTSAGTITAKITYVEGA